MAANELVPLEIKLPAPAFKGTPKDIQVDGDLKKNKTLDEFARPPMMAGNSSFGFGFPADSTVQGPGGARPQTLPEANAFRRRYAQISVPPAATELAVTAAPATVPPPAATATAHDGKLLYEMGKLDEADVKLKQALKEEPHNVDALNSLNLVSEAKYLRAAKSREVTMRQDIRAVEQAWANPVKRELLPAKGIPAEGLADAGLGTATAQTGTAPANSRVRVEKFGVQMPDTERTAGDLVLSGRGAVPAGAFPAPVKDALGDLAVSGRGLKPGQDIAGVRKGAELLREPAAGEPGLANPTSGALGGGAFGGFAAIPNVQFGGGGFGGGGRGGSAKGYASVAGDRQPGNVASSNERQYPKNTTIGDAYFSIDPETRRVVNIADEATARAIGQMLTNTSGGAKANADWLYESSDSRTLADGQKTPMLGDVPALGRFYRSESSSAGKDTKALGFDWYLGNVLMNNSKPADSRDQDASKPKVVAELPPITAHGDDFDAIVSPPGSAPGKPADGTLTVNNWGDIPPTAYTPSLLAKDKPSSAVLAYKFDSVAHGVQDLHRDSQVDAGALKAKVEEEAKSVDFSGNNLIERFLEDKADHPDVLVRPIVQGKPTGLA
ncbi:MAG: hypothetical protein NT154_23250, partial [Verrucomicrobia bacterium]|nr:hypothetical protein [Verrucomicrobiota bacterium]